MARFVYREGAGTGRQPTQSKPNPQLAKYLAASELGTAAGSTAVDDEEVKKTIKRIAAGSSAAAKAAVEAVDNLNAALATLFPDTQAGKVDSSPGTTQASNLTKRKKVGGLASPTIFQSVEEYQALADLLGVDYTPYKPPPTGAQQGVGGFVADVAKETGGDTLTLIKTGAVGASPTIGAGGEPRVAGTKAGQAPAVPSPYDAAAKVFGVDTVATVLAKLRGTPAGQVEPAFWAEIAQLPDAGQKLAEAFDKGLITTGQFTTMAELLALYGGQSQATASEKAMVQGESPTSSTTATQEPPTETVPTEPEEGFRVVTQPDGTLVLTYVGDISDELAGIHAVSEQLSNVQNALTAAMTSDANGRVSVTALRDAVQAAETVLATTVVPDVSHIQTLAASTDGVSMEVTNYISAVQTITANIENLRNVTLKEARDLMKAQGDKDYNEYQIRQQASAGNLSAAEQAAIKYQEAQTRLLELQAKMVPIQIMMQLFQNPVALVLAKQFGLFDMLQSTLGVTIAMPNWLQTGYIDPARVPSIDELKTLNTAQQTAWMVAWLDAHPGATPEEWMRLIMSQMPGPASAPGRYVVF